MRRKLWIVCMIICFAALLTGCFEGERGSDDLERNEQPNLHEPKQVTLKVYTPRFYFQEFMEIYGGQIEENFEHIKLELVEPNFNDTEDEEISRYINYLMEQEIDLFLSPGPESKELLIALDEFIAKPSFEANNIYSNLLDIHREEDGFIYSLSPSLTGQALYYNKELFDQYQVEYPRDYMSWEEIIFLAAQFPEQEVTGLLYEVPPSFLLEDMLNTNRVEIIDEQNRLNILHNGALKEVLDLFVSLNPDHKLENFMSNDNDRFENGNVAMIITDIGNVESFDIDFEWDLVSRPIPPDGSKETAYLLFHHNLSIFSGTYHLEEAWEIISFINGEDVEGNYMEDSLFWRLPVRHSKLIKKTEKNYDHLYTLKPNYYTAIPDTVLIFEFGNEFRSILHSVLQRILIKDISIEQGIIEINDRAQALLHEW